jgi:hypothetical protein
VCEIRRVQTARILAKHIFVIDQDARLVILAIIVWRYRDPELSPGRG